MLGPQRQPSSLARIRAEHKQTLAQLETMRLLRIFPYVRELEQDNERLADDLQKALAGELTIESLSVRNGVCRIEMGTRMASYLASSFHEILNELGAKNYVEMQFGDADGKTVCVTLVRHEGKTPNDLLVEATDRAKLAESTLARILSDLPTNRDPELERLARSIINKETTCQDTKPSNSTAS
jgi:hypothetical protein